MDYSIFIIYFNREQIEELQRETSKLRAEMDMVKKHLGIEIEVNKLQLWLRLIVIWLQFASTITQ